MFNRNTEFDEITLVWTAVEYDDCSKIISTIVKPEDLELKKFFTSTENKGYCIFLDYKINDVSLASWLNMNYFQRKVIGPIHSYDEPIGSLKNPFYRKILLKRMFGLEITREDAQEAANYYKHNEPKSAEALEEERKLNEEYASRIFDEENSDTMLYCSGCCGDRACGYFGIGVSQSKDSVIWFANLGKHLNLKFSFEKEQYISAFREIIEMINQEISEKGGEPFWIEGTSESWYRVEDYAPIVAQKYNLKQTSFSREQLDEIFKAGEIKEIDSSLFIAQSFGYNLEHLREEVEATYCNLSEKDKNLIEWKIIDNATYWGTIELFEPTLTKKILLLYSESFS
ncbi:hypothetical protein [Aureispira sp. CCB-E]|uniref:hypothetical protein n=1 Tax=Aureispira sp. CCB-E TaxID=3051121 RepID=UPI0028685AC8|nr:hypothetical protein [Aureispira sp. CCB-E]WMX12513.1 hypothetical protein QP953_16915 [Aureispira sp. CCB-E]